MGEMVGDQTANQAANPSKKRKKKFTSSGTIELQPSCCDVTNLSSRPVCVYLLMMLEPSCGRWQVGEVPQD
jgi:hypothetical protein